MQYSTGRRIASQSHLGYMPQYIALGEACKSHAVTLHGYAIQRGKKSCKSSGSHLGYAIQRWEEAQKHGREVQAEDQDGDEDEGALVVAGHPLRRSQGFCSGLVCGAAAWQQGVHAIWQHLQIPGKITTTVKLLYSYLDAGINYIMHSSLWCFGRNQREVCRPWL